jgi:hypothetical protein
MNEQSLQAANDFLRVASATTQAGDLLDRPPTEIGKEAGLPNPLAVARAVRALAARRRLAAEDGKYRLLDPRPLEADEPESVPRAPRRRKGRKRAATAKPESAPSTDRRPTWADLGRSVVDRIIELGRESGEATAAADHLRRELKENRAARIEAEQRASRLFERSKELEHKLEMAEVNLRTVLAAARGRGATAGPSDNEMEALLRILKTPAGQDGESAEGGEADAAAAPTAPTADVEAPAEAPEEEPAETVDA